MIQNIGYKWSSAGKNGAKISECSDVGFMHDKGGFWWLGRGWPRYNWLGEAAGLFCLRHPHHTWHVSSSKVLLHITNLWAGKENAASYCRVSPCCWGVTELSANQKIASLVPGRKPAVLHSSSRQTVWMHPNIEDRSHVEAQKLYVKPERKYVSKYEQLHIC